MYEAQNERLSKAALSTGVVTLGADPAGGSLESPWHWVRLMHETLQMALLRSLETKSVGAPGWA